MDAIINSFSMLLPHMTGSRIFIKKVKEQQQQCFVFQQSFVANAVLDQLLTARGLRLTRHLHHTPHFIVPVVLFTTMMLAYEMLKYLWPWFMQHRFTMVSFYSAVSTPDRPSFAQNNIASHWCTSPCTNFLLLF